jgi:hypothetical protein
MPIIDVLMKPIWLFPKKLRDHALGGGGKYKEKYGGQIVVVPWLRKSRYRFIAPLRNAAKRLVATSQRVRGSLQSRR